MRKWSEEVENKPSKVATYRSTKRARQKKTTEGVRKQDVEERKRVQVDMERRRTEDLATLWLIMAVVANGH